ncbi:DNA polymerase III subunit gamma and tau [Rothia uropygioeca]|uniref:DNA polymerase III subunit gamma and tau n=1 Tax=Kocuria sp. 257 TaxID=2021970 RepID=UPI0010122CEB|nr:DNA polymerase III subunit gamma and tau [Kocuria sp. 257]
MSTALYRRYRPETFEDVIGQEHVTNPLMTALQKNRVNHAYLFSGPRGCGKTTSARILARCLNCAEGPTARPCGKCESCVDLARDGAGSLDVIEMDAASHGGVDHARDLRERATFAPVRDRYKIFIIDEAHMVTREGFNALLKIVEEPPEHIKFIFATTEPNKVLGTIRSRTHHYPFRLVAPEVLRGYLNHLCDKESIQVEQGVLPLVVRAGGGSVRDSLSVLDQLMAGASESGITYDLAVALLGFTHAELLDGVVDAFAAGDSPAVFHAVDRVVQTGQDPRRFVEDLLERFRDLIIVKAVPESAAQILHGMSEDQIDRMRGQATQLGASELSRAADIANTALTEMTGATSPQLHLELLCARILLPTADDTSRGVNARVDRLERRINFGSVGAVQAPLQSDPAAATTPETPAQHIAAEAVSQAPEPTEEVPASGASAREAALSLARKSRESATEEAELSVERTAEEPSEDHAEAAEAPQPRPNDETEQAPPSPADQEQPAAAPAQETSAPDSGQVNMIERSWADVVAAVGKYSKVGQATFRECRPTRFDNGVLYVTSSGPGIQSRVERFASALSGALKDTLGLECAVSLDDGRPGGGPGRGSSEPNGSGPSGQGSSTRDQNSHVAQGRRPENAPARTPQAAATEADDWPGEEAWNPTARQAQSKDHPAAETTGSPLSSRGTVQSPSTGAGDPSPIIPEGSRGGEEAWQKHGIPLSPDEDSDEPEWSEDSSGESFTGWKVAPIPSDEAPQPDGGRREVSASETAGSAGPESTESSTVPTGNSSTHLHVVKEDEDTNHNGQPSRDSDSLGTQPSGESEAIAAPVEDGPQGSDASSDGSAEAEARAGHPSAPAAEERLSSHDWSVAARQAGAPGKAVDGRECGWRYSGPESEESASEHPSKWGQRMPHLTEVDGGAPERGTQTTATTNQNSPIPGGEKSRHLHAVRDDEEAQPGRPQGPASSQAEQTDSGDAPGEQSAPFRERHADAIEAGSGSPSGPAVVRGRNGNVLVDPNAPEPPDDEWDGFVPSPHDEDIEDSSVFGQAAIETILGGRVLEERPHHRG